MAAHITYEQPLNERVRTFLRMEHLFDISGYYLGGQSEWDSRLCLSSLLEIVDLLSRSDLKNELIKELERHFSTLSGLQSNPGVDQTRLQAIMQDINEYITELRDGSCQPGLILKKDELVSSIKQRNAIPGGTCRFDLPAYHHWLSNPPAERTRDLEAWQQDLAVVRNGLKLALHMLRNSSTPTRERAPQGFFQQPMESNIACQLVRVMLPVDSPYFPEISGGRHRFTVRFMEQANTKDRPVQTEATVEFELHCCIL